jgi:hypothetical protein
VQIMARTALIGGALALAATQAAAIPVTLDPDGERVDLALPADAEGVSQFEGVFRGQGFEFTAETYEDIFPAGPDDDRALDVSRVNETLTGFTNLASAVTIRRTDGAPFDLVSIEIPDIYVDDFFGYFGRVAGSDESVDDFAARFVDLVGLEGVTASGETVSTSFAPVNDTTVQAGLFAASFTNPDPVFGPEAFGPGFDDLVSLTYAIPGERLGELRFTAVDFALDPDPCDPEVLTQVDPRFALSPPCAPEATDPPLLDVSILEGTELVGRNNFYEFEVGAITVETPAPIPVPASLPLLAGGLAGLTLAARRRRR